MHAASLAEPAFDAAGVPENFWQYLPSHHPVDNVQCPLCLLSCQSVGRVRASRWWVDTALLGCPRLDCRLVTAHLRYSIGWLPVHEATVITAPTRRSGILWVILIVSVCYRSIRACLPEQMTPTNWLWLSQGMVVAGSSGGLWDCRCILTVNAGLCACGGVCGVA